MSLIGFLLRFRKSGKLNRLFKYVECLTGLSALACLVCLIGITVNDNYSCGYMHIVAMVYSVLAWFIIGILFIWFIVVLIFLKRSKE